MEPTPLVKALTLLQNNQLADARNACQEVLSAAPDHQQALYILAVIAFRTGDYRAAEELIQRVIGIKAGDANMYNMLGASQFAQGKASDAMHSYQRALQLSPDNPSALFGIGNINRDCGDFTAAGENFLRIVITNPDNESAWSHLGSVYWQTGRYQEAINAFRKAVELKPGLAHTHGNLGNALLEQGDAREAVDCLQRAAEISQTAGARICASTAIPPIMESSGQIREFRQQLLSNLQQLIDGKPAVSDPLREIGKTSFFLAYHGENDRVLQAKFAELYISCCPDLQWTAPHCNGRSEHVPGDKIRIGFLSRHFRNHSIARTSTGIIALLPRDRFHVIAIFLDPPSDEMGRKIAQVADEVVILPGSLQVARSMLSARTLDILYYQDIGMDVFSYFLAFSRLAPVQCTSFGHPETSGIPNIDYYISTRAWEPEDGSEHYSEKLVMLEHAVAVTSYDKPVMPEILKTHEQFGLDMDRNIYTCPQALFKFSPEFDRILAGILQRDPKGVLVLFEGRFPRWTQIIMERLAKVIPDSAHRVLILPQQRSIDFINLLALSDVVLDTIHFCGFNTTLEAFTAGTPVVTMPGKFMRSRHTAAYYHAMDIDECIASNPEEYIDIALRLATDPEYRADISNRINNSVSKLWNDHTVIDDLAAAFTAMARERIPGMPGTV